MEKEKAGQIGTSGLVGRSLKAFQTETIQTIKVKSDASVLSESIVPNRKQGLSIQNHLHSIGADRDVLSDDDQINRQIMYKWFRTLVLFNDRFPKDLPVLFVLDEFFEDILQHRVTLKGHNLHAHIEAFREWATTRIGHARKKYWLQLNPDRRPKELESNASKSDEERQVDEQRVQKAMKLLYGDEVPESMRKFKIKNEENQ